MKKGFTLIETLVVVGSILLVLVSIGAIVSGIFGSQRKNRAVEQIGQNGGWLLNELKKNVINADGSGENGLVFSCPVGSYGDSITFRNVRDGNTTTISCIADGDSYKIASASARETTTIFQKKDGLVLDGCNNFVTCSTMPDFRLSSVKFNFSLVAGDGGSSEQLKTFSADVTIRN